MVTGLGLPSLPELVDTIFIGGRRLVLSPCCGSPRRHWSSFSAPPASRHRTTGARAPWRRPVLRRFSTEDFSDSTFSPSWSGTRARPIPFGGGIVPKSFAPCASSFSSLLVLWHLSCTSDILAHFGHFSSLATTCLACSSTSFNHV